MSPSGSPPPLPAARTRILLVDDHPMMRDSLRLMLEQQPGLAVVGVGGDCATAWELVKDLHPALVLMDLDLPDGSGLALTRRIRQKFPGTKVLVLTAHQGQAVAAAEAGAQGYLVKTEAATELLAAVKSVIAGRIFLPEECFAGHPPAPHAGASEAAARVLKHLPVREGQVLNLLVRGLRNKEIAAELALNVKTVESYRSRLMKRFGCQSPAELVRHAIRSGLAEA